MTGTPIVSRRLVAGLLGLALLAGACGTAGTSAEAPAAGGAATTAAADHLLELAPADAIAHLGRIDGPVLLNVWASWCPPCRDEAPRIAAAARAYDGEVTFIGVNFEDSPDGAARFIDLFGLDFHSFFDPRGEIAAALGLRGIPVTLVLDADGVESYRRIGSISESELVTALDAVTR